MILRLLFTAIIFLAFGSAYYGNRIFSSEAGVAPDSPFYFIDNIIEKADIFSTKDKEEKIEKLIKLINEKVAESEEMLGRDKIMLAKSVLNSADSYFTSGLGALLDLKKEGKDVSSLALELGEVAVKKRSVLADAFENAPEEARDFLKKEIEEGRDGVQKIINEVNEETAEKIKTADIQVQEILADEMAKVLEKKEESELSELSATEKLYNIWIAQMYYKKESDGRISISAHIKRRDQKCSRFVGKFNLYAEGALWRTFDFTADGYDDARKEFDRLVFEKGSYTIKGELVDLKGKIISKREMRIVN